MKNTLLSIENVVNNFSRMIVADGGNISIQSFDEDESILIVDYFKGSNLRCEYCVIDEVSLRDFIAEALGARGIEVHNVVINSVQP